MGTELTVAEDTTLYARWEKEAEKPEERPEATITSDADGGEMEVGDITAKVGDTITLPACTKEGYEPSVWNTTLQVSCALSPVSSAFSFSHRA